MSSSVPSEKLAAIILCGGNSVRMGFDKSQLLLGDGQTFLEQIVSTLKPHVGSVIVVHNAQLQILDNPEVICVTDRRPDCGPMEGIATGLAAMPDEAELGFVTSCDVPLIRPEVALQLLDLLGDNEGVTPVDGKRIFGLTAIYRKSILPALESLIESKMLKVSNLCQHLRIRQVPIELIRAVDPFLESLNNINRYSDYEQLANQLGFEIDPDLARQLNLD